MSGGGQSGNTSTQAIPWAGIQPSLTSFYQNANNAWNQGNIAPWQNTGQVQPWTQDQANAYNQAISGGNNAAALSTNLANGNLAGSGNIGAISLAGDTRGQFAGNTGNILQGLAAGNGGSQASTTLNNLAAGNFGNSPALSGLLATAQGQGIDPNNPQLQGEINAASQPLVQNFQQAVLPGLLSTFSQAGRLGSGANMQAINQASTALGQQLSNLSGTLTGQNYQQGLQNQLAAQQGLAGLQSGAANTLLGGQLQAGGTLGSLAAQSGSNLAALQGNALSALPGMTSSNIGTSSIYNSYLQNLLNSQINQQNFNNTLPLQALQNMTGLLNPGLTLNGSSTRSSSSPSVSPFGTALGGAATGAAIGSALPGVGTAIGAGVGGVAGLLGGLL